MDTGLLFDLLQTKLQLEQMVVQHSDVPNLAESFQNMIKAVETLIRQAVKPKITRITEED